MRFLMDRRRFGVAMLAGVASFMCPGCANLSGKPKPMAAGEGIHGPWWMRQTAMSVDGALDLSNRPWWARATQLRVGECFILVKPDGLPEEQVDLSRGGSAGVMLVRREHFKNRSQETDAIVWIIDDDDDGSISAGGDKDSDCYVVDYGPDGVVDRMVDYIDNDGDNDADEMDIRYFVDGRLRQLWCGLDLDDDSSMWDLAGYEYSGDFFKSDPYGDSMIFMNRFDPERGCWIPISECPFAFYDTDDDGFSEIAVRVSAVPLAYDTGTDPDYANDTRRYRGQWSEDMRRMGVVNIRYSFDIDHGSGPESPLHYDFGLNLVGATPYVFPEMERFNAKRRPPQVTRVIPHDRLRAISDRYEARETGFSWHEQYDDTITIGGVPETDLDCRWEGVFWVWERRFMENTGGPNQKWNVRREWCRRRSDRRQLYYSHVDRRIHLFGAEEGWIEIGHFGGLGELGEIRMYDTDGNGCFDRWEVYLGDEPVPVRVTTVRDERAVPVPFDHECLSRFYTRDVLPEAMADNTRLIEKMNAVRSFTCPEGLAQAMDTGPVNYRRFAQDVARELQYQDLRRHLTIQAHRVLTDAGVNDLRQMDAEQRRNTPNSYTAWRLLRLLEELDVAYGQGDYTQAYEVLSEILIVKELFAE